jgi:hypothetical protein
MSQPFDPSSQASRALAIEEERLANTRAALTEVVSPSGGGRFATTLRQQINTVEYPWLPSGPWTGPQPPPEESLGFSVEEMPVMGEPHEAERAANLLHAAVGLGPSGTDADLCFTGSATAAGLPNATPPHSLGVAEVEGSPLLSSSAAEFASSFTRQAPDPLPSDAAHAPWQGERTREEHHGGSGSTPSNNWRRY